MAAHQRLICPAAALIEREHGVRFSLPERGERATGFVVRMYGNVYGYVNSCAHMPVELDWEAGNFFDLTRTYLICATHGAHYEVSTGYCTMGPCKGKSLQPLDVVERDGNIYLNLKLES